MALSIGCDEKVQIFILEVLFLKNDNNLCDLLSVIKTYSTKLVVQEGFARKDIIIINKTRVRRG